MYPIELLHQFVGISGNTAYDIVGGASSFLQSAMFEGIGHVIN
jgi:hypothetical protein